MPKKPRNVAIVHTAPDSLLDDVRKLGWNPLPCPVLSVVPVAYDDHSLKDMDYSVITSVHAIPSALAAARPVIAVGIQTSEMAKESGLDVLPHSLAQAQDLLSLRDQLTGLTTIHLAGVHVAPDTPAIMDQLGISSVAVYEAIPKVALSPEIESCLDEGTLAAILLFSARSAHIFTDLANRVTNRVLWQDVIGVALSPSVAQAMASLPFASIKIASAPHRNSILEALGHEQFS